VTRLKYAQKEQLCEYVGRGTVSKFVNILTHHDFVPLIIIIIIIIDIVTMMIIMTREKKNADRYVNQILCVAENHTDMMMMMMIFQWPNRSPPPIIEASRSHSDTPHSV
jgi:hypothetical protein